MNRHEITEQIVAARLSRGQQPIPAELGEVLVEMPGLEGDRVVATFDGKFLPYQWVSAEN